MTLEGAREFAAALREEGVIPLKASNYTVLDRTKLQAYAATGMRSETVGMMDAAH